MSIDITKFKGGDGSILNPYLIDHPDGLNEIRNGLNYYYKLIKDIDMNIYPYNINQGFIPIGIFSTTPFLGGLDGSNFKIKNLYINNIQLNGVGLFSYGGGQFKNLFLDNVNIIGNARVGSLYGHLSYTATISNCICTGNITGNTIIGGLIGLTSNVSINNCYSSCTINSTGNSMIGGFIGYISSNSKITNCYSNGKVNSTLINSGFTGEYNSTNSIITSCYWDINTSGKTTSAGNNIIGKTTIQMQTQSTYIGWDFINIWYMDSLTKYPNLLNFKNPNKFLIQDGDRIKITTDGINLIDLGLTYNDDTFNQYGMSDLSLLNSTVLEKIINNEYKILMYKVK